MHLGNGKTEIKVTEQNSKVFNTSITSLAFKILKTCPGYLASLRKKKKKLISRFNAGHALGAGGSNTFYTSNRKM